MKSSIRFGDLTFKYDSSLNLLFFELIWFTSNISMNRILHGIVSQTWIGRERNAYYGHYYIRSFILIL